MTKDGAVVVAKSADPKYDNPWTLGNVAAFQHELK